MKKILLIISVAAFIFSSCNNNPSQSDSHKHEDGTEHKDGEHAHSSDTVKPSQSSFEIVDGDTVKTETKCSDHGSDHNHGSEKSHNHDNEKEHKH